MIWSELELRWVLLGLGLLVVLGVFLGGLLKSRSRPSETARSEPDFWPEEPEAAVSVTESTQLPDGVTVTTEAGIGVPEFDLPSAGDYDEGFGEPQDAPGTAHVAAATERVVSLRLIPLEGEQLDAERTVRALREVGLQHGPFDIFHYCEDRNVPESGFSVANLIEPGSFDLSDLVDSTLPGVTFFLVLPGSRDPVERFDKMIDIARELCQTLDAELFDELGSLWSIQSERFVREELIEYKRRQFRI